MEALRNFVSLFHLLQSAVLKMENVWCKDLFTVWLGCIFFVLRSNINKSFKNYLNFNWYKRGLLFCKWWELSAAEVVVWRGERGRGWGLWRLMGVCGGNPDQLLKACSDRLIIAALIDEITTYRRRNLHRSPSFLFGDLFGGVETRVGGDKSVNVWVHKERAETALRPESWWNYECKCAHRSLVADLFSHLKEG